MKSRARKTSVEVSVDRKTALLWDDRPSNVDAGVVVRPLKDLPRLTAKFLTSALTLQDGQIVRVYTSSILRSDYWQQTTHPLKWVEYRVVDGRLEKICRKSMTM